MAQALGAKVTNCKGATKKISFKNFDAYTKSERTVTWRKHKSHGKDQRNGMHGVYVNQFVKALRDAEISILQE